MSTTHIFTSESVSEGHPDKVADRISDSLVDAYLSEDPRARVAVETLVTEGFVCVAGEVRSRHVLEPDAIDAMVRDCVRDIGYTGGWDGRFDADSVQVDVRLHSQSSEIGNAVDKQERKAQGAGDQGMMFGYASSETPELMPAPITWAHGLTRELARLRKAGEVAWLRPDAKSQVSVRYAQGRPCAVDTIVVSTQHEPGVKPSDIRDLLVERVVPRVVDDAMLPDGWQDRVLANPSGSFVEGGPATDTGLTGRKIIVDTYGGMARHGGGAFSGKDPSKVDRSAAYATRWVAKNVVAAGKAERCEIQIAYAIGVAQPLALAVETFGTGESEDAIIAWIRDRFDLSPHGIIDELKLDRPIYSPTAAYGHVGRRPGVDGEFPWEVTRS